MIVKVNDKYQVRSRDSDKVLGEHDTREGALRQLRAIEANKAKREIKK